MMGDDFQIFMLFSCASSLSNICDFLLRFVFFYALWCSFLLFRVLSCLFMLQLGRLLGRLDDGRRRTANLQLFIPRYVKGRGECPSRNIPRIVGPLANKSACLLLVLYHTILYCCTILTKYENDRSIKYSPAAERYLHRITNCWLGGGGRSGG
jgi:hypothetical protein